MIRAVQVGVFLLGASVALSAVPCQASLYTPGDPTSALPVNPDGKPDPLPFEEFQRRLQSLKYALDDRKTNGAVNPERQKFLTLIQEAEKVRKPSADDTAALAGYLLRIGQFDRATALLAPLAHGRNPSYFAIETLVHIHATTGEWAEARGCIGDALFSAGMPASAKGYTDSQLKWWKTLDSEYLPLYCDVRYRDSIARKGLTPEQLARVNETEDAFPLFPLPEKDSGKTPVRFVNDEGKYQPGHLAAAERAKLPQDAIPIVQQMMLWFPGDTRLYWLLAELYAANNDLKAADTIFQQCSWSGQYSSRKILMEHRAAVRAALPKETAAGDAPLTQSASSQPPPPAKEEPITMRTVWLYFGCIGVVVLFAIARGKLRRSRDDCGPSG